MIQWFLCVFTNILTWFNVTELICIHNTTGNQHYWVTDCSILSIYYPQYWSIMIPQSISIKLSQAILCYIEYQTSTSKNNSKHTVVPVCHETHVLFRTKLIERHESMSHSWGGNHIPCDTSGIYFLCKTLDNLNQNNTNWTLKRSMIVV